MMRRLLLRVGLLIGVLLVWGLSLSWLGAPDSPSNATRSAAEQRAEAVRAAQRLAEGDGPRSLSVEAGNAPGPVEPSQPESLRGSELDGRLRADAQGNLVIDRDLRRLFDHLLAGIGDVSLEALRARLRELALEEGGETLARQALDLFDRYAGYLQAESSLGLPESADLADRLEALMALRRAQLGEDLSEAWFGEEERYALDALDRLEGGEGMDEAPEAEQWAQARHEATAHIEAQTQTQAFEASGAPAEQRLAERTERFGAEAAQRLAQLDASRADWQVRLDDWRRVRAELENDASLDDAAREQALQSELARRFDEAEQRRVRALDELPPEG